MHLNNIVKVDKTKAPEKGYPSHLIKLIEYFVSYYGEKYNQGFTLKDVSEDSGAIRTQYEQDSNSFSFCLYKMECVDNYFLEITVAGLYQEELLNDLDKSESHFYEIEDLVEPSLNDLEENIDSKYLALLAYATRNGINKMNSAAVEVYEKTFSSNSISNKFTLYFMCIRDNPIYWNHFYPKLLKQLKIEKNELAKSFLERTISAIKIDE